MSKQTLKYYDFMRLCWGGVPEEEAIKQARWWRGIWTWIVNLRPEFSCSFRLTSSLRFPE